MAYETVTTRALSALFCAVILTTILYSCSCSNGVDEKESGAGQITVAAAANLIDAFAEIGREFTEQTGAEVTFSFGSTADLAKQIENGAPFDVFASADVATIERLKERGLIVPESQSVFARGRLVLWLPPNGRASIDRIEDLARSNPNALAIAKPEVAPYGKAAVEALQSLGLWATLQPAVVYSTNVAQARQFALSGNADAAFIPLSLAMSAGGRYIEVEQRLHAPIDQAMGIVRASSKQELARRFEDFVLGERGRAILERFGYKMPPAIE